MKPVDQIVFDIGLGDCGRACVASILEFDVQDMPNFWVQTQRSDVFWTLQNDWLSINKGFRLIPIVVNPGHEDLLRGLICIAVGNTDRCDEEHAVVWCDGVVHDPHPSRAGLKGDPSVFVLIVPIDPISCISRCEEEVKKRA